MKYLLMLLPLLFVGCGKITEAKAQAWAELKCEPHLGVYVTKTTPLREASTYCKDGTYFYESNIHKFTHPTVADYLPKDSHDK